ncbi:hypothetical protein GALMADRAFT_215042 [Galerina marginata CBS 339.88]|uniref:Uncharacterized protein n=1 Tax=Galerina marginata (strain CBS 339.88) TaxID=685588 RepID=A0A067SSC6_GALM3|nr:hypothetical protein GALMADRAFT_215042 [Galerina marginata CBS 339.88]
MSTQDLNPAWTPPLGPDVLYTEYTWFAGVFVQAVGYGVTIPLAIQCEVFLYKSINHTNFKKKLAWMILVFVLFVCATVCAVAEEKMGELGFIYYRNYPGGPSAFELDFNSLPVNGIANVFIVIADWICVGIQLWRCYILYSPSVVPVWLIMSIPCLAYFASIALGILWAIQVTQPNSNTFITTGINWTAPYLGLTLALNIVLSAALVLRLVYYRWRLARAGLGTSRMGGGVNYLGIAAMISESTIIYSTFSLLALIFFLTNRTIQNIFDPLFPMTEIIAAYLILYRVASGSAWSAGTVSQLFSNQSSSVESGKQIQFLSMRSTDTSRTKISTFGDSTTLASSFSDAVAK